MKNNFQKKKGFTLIELLLVIGIIMIISASAVLVLNPTEIMAQSRDRVRMSDMNALKSDINTFIANTNVTLTLGSCTTNGRLTAGTAGVTPSPFGAHPLVTSGDIVSDVTITGTGWVDVNFNNMNGFPPLSVLPKDPVNNNTYLYAYKCENVNYTYKFVSRLESLKFRDNMKIDGGIYNCATAGNYATTDCWYEVGSNPNL